MIKLRLRAWVVCYRELLWYALVIVVAALGEGWIAAR